MSGGAFDYQQYRLHDIADTLREIIVKTRMKQEWYDGYSDRFLQEMVETHDELRRLAVRVHRLDWVLSADDGEDTYWERLKEDNDNIEYDNPAQDGAYLSAYSGNY